VLDGEYIRNSEDHLYDDGCCLVCNSNEQMEGCWCSNVACHNCDWYEGSSYDDEGEHNFRGYKKGWCTFPGSVFDVPNFEEIVRETEKAYCVKIKDYPSFWLPKKGCKIEIIENEKYLSIKGWIIELKSKQYDECKNNDEEILSELFYEISMNNYIDNDF